MYETGEKIKVSIFGQSHSAAIGAVISGIPAGIKIDMDKVLSFMARRAPGKDRFSTQRKEADIPEILSGIVDGITCGAPICAVIKNTDQKSKDYDKLKFVPRPAHADFTAFIKFCGNNDIRGGGQFSGRMTAPLCFAGAICMQILEKKGIYIGSHIASIADVCDQKYDAVNVTKDDLKRVTEKEFPVIDDEKAAVMMAKIDEARLNSDSVGGVVECAVVGMPIGVGDALFGGIEGNISKAVFGIPAVRGIEFGAGFDASKVSGSENNDPFYYDGDMVKTRTNNHGGILGGISSGMPIIFRVAIKPTPSIAREQESVNLKTHKSEKLKIEGRHDPCIVKRALPAVEAVTAITILNMLGE